MHPLLTLLFVPTFTTLNYIDNGLVSKKKKEKVSPEIFIIPLSALKDSSKSHPAQSPSNHRHRDVYITQEDLLYHQWRRAPCIPLALL